MFVHHHGDNLSTIITVDYASKEIKKVFCSFDARYYDEIITRLRLQAIEKYQYNMQQQQRVKLQEQEEEEKLRDQNNKKRILLVDDEPDICLLYQIVLQDAGYECKSYTDSAKAIQEFRPNYYDLILLDIKMPLINGFELCKKIIELDNTIQIIFITASEEYYNKLKKQSYPELSNIVSIQKPIGNEDLVKVVNRVLATKGPN